MFHPSPSIPPGTDFDFAFDPSLFPPPPLPPLPSSADLFSPSETTDLYGFLDNFNFDFDPDQYMDGPPTRSPPPYSNPHLSTAPDASTSRRAQSRPTSSRSSVGSPSSPESAVPQRLTRSVSNASSRPPPLSAADEAARAKALLSTPQKRLNHIMSEQKRRNAIRDGYAQLISLIAPAGSAQTIAMPSRGRPKGSGNRNKGRTQGKSGVLFRSVEYIKFMEEGRDALLEEVLKLERMAGIINGD